MIRTPMASGKLRVTHSHRNLSTRGVPLAGTGKTVLLRWDIFLGIRVVTDFSWRDSPTPCLGGTAAEIPIGVLMHLTDVDTFGTDAGPEKSARQLKRHSPRYAGKRTVR